MISATSEFIFTTSATPSWLLYTINNKEEALLYYNNIINYFHERALTIHNIIIVITYLGTQELRARKGTFLLYRRYYVQYI
jgi:hypothetical protein